MKVALINKVFSLGYGGGERYGVNLAKSLCSKGIEVHLFGTVVEDVPSEAVVHSVTAPVRPGFARVTGFVSHTRPMGEGPRLLHFVFSHPHKLPPRLGYRWSPP